MVVAAVTMYEQENSAGLVNASRKRTFSWMLLKLSVCYTVIQGATCGQMKSRLPKFMRTLAGRQNARVHAVK